MFGLGVGMCVDVLLVTVKLRTSMHYTLFTFAITKENNVFSPVLNKNIFSEVLRALGVSVALSCGLPQGPLFGFLYSCST